MTPQPAPPLPAGSRTMSGPTIARPVPPSRASPGRACGGPGTGTPRQWLLLVTVGLPAFITALDNTVVVISLPAIGRELGLGRAGLEWVGASYLLTFAALLLPGGRLADRWGRREALVAGTAGFVLASAAAAWSPTGAWLVGARAAQGVGGALLLPAALAVLAADLEPAVRRLAAGVWTAAIAVALSIGPLVGGLLTQVAGWRWVFLINVPVGAAAIALALVTLASRPVPAAAAPGTPRCGTPRCGTPRWRFLDLPGLLTSALGLLALTGALVEWHAGGGRGTGVRIAVVVAVVSWAGFVAVERRSSSPLIPVTLWRRPAFTGGTLAQVLWGLGINGILFFTAMYLQGVLGLGPTAAGAVFVPIAVAVALAVLPTPRLVDRFGAARVVVVGMVLVALGLLGVELADPASGVAGVVPGLVLVGAGSGLTTPLTDGILAAVPAERSGVASAVVSAAREMSGVLGIAVVGLVLTGIEQVQEGAGRSPQEAFLAGYRGGLAFSAAAVLCGAAAAWVALRGRPGAGPGY